MIETDTIVKSLTILRSYNYLGEQTASNGTYLIGKAPHIAPLAWLHSIYPPLTDEQIIALETQTPAAVPKDYKEFLKISNGLNVFNTTLSLYGYRRNFNRNIEDVWQPFDLITPNTVERLKNAGKNVFFIGGYDWDGSLLYIDTNTNKVHLCERENAKSLYEWHSFNEMLLSEIERLIMLFDKQGRQLNEDESTLPI